MITEKTINADCYAECKELRAQIKERLAHYARLGKRVIEYGGLVGLWEAASMLGISRQRVCVLIKKERIRRIGMDLSLADVKAYKRSPRKPGRPKSLQPGPRRRNH